MNDIQGKIKSFLEKYKLDCPEKIFLVFDKKTIDRIRLLEYNKIATKKVAIKKRRQEVMLSREEGV